MKHHVLTVFATSSDPSASEKLPLYVLRDGNLYRTAFHPKGWSEHPDYEFKSDGHLYRTPCHELGVGLAPDYTFGRDQKLYRTHNHPDGRSCTPEYEIQD
ncbi:MAG: hypothetical protein V1793_15680 [Pseudomonadota bacterium]